MGLNHTDILQMHRHDIHLVKCLVTSRALPHTIAKPRLETSVAKHVSASLDNRILEVVATHWACSEFLGHIVSTHTHNVEARGMQDLP